MEGMRRTTFPITHVADRRWHVLDAEGQVLGRLATRIVTILRGKDKPLFAPALDCGDFVVVVNAGKVKLTGKKLEQKIDYRHSGYPKGDRYTLYRQLMVEHPERPVTLAVKGMLPKNRLRDRMLRRLKVYAGSEHPHGAQLAQAVRVASAGASQ